MWRYYLAATVIVAVFVFVVTLRKQSPPDLEVSAPAHGTPSAPRSQGPERATPSAVSGDAPWALSALPDCAHQDSERRGPNQFVRDGIPRDAQAAHGTLRAGPCSIHVTSDGIIVVRGKDRLRIPPPARLLESNGRYFLYTQNRKDAVLRVYSFKQ